MPTLNQHLDGMQPGRELFKVASPTLVAGRLHSYFYVAGMPNGASTPSAGMAGEALTTHEAQIPFPNAGGGLNTYLARLMLSATIPGQILVCDRLWQNSGITITSTGSQTIDSVAFPARDDNESTNGAGVLVGLEVSAATGAGTPTLTVGYTNSAGTASRSATQIGSTVASSAIGAFYPIGLQGGDSGVRSIQTYTQSATWTSGTVHLVAYRVLGRLGIPVANTPASMDLITGGQPKAWNNSVPFLIFLPSTTTATTLNGHIIWSIA